ncbi:hypothetical protein D9O50_09110 [Oxalobacteraceae bacterium CAVE-383]|nr:hypothetical protein D9O50_09110 [Oxalobacteraceae bacterium CAVE-383]
MTAKVPPPPLPLPHKAKVLRLIPTIDKPLATNCMDVAVKLKRALQTAKTGVTTGAVIIELNSQGDWSVDLAGQLVHDEDTLFLIASRVFGACLLAK